MLNIKLCVFDLDGTLLNSNGDISNDTIESIKKLKSKNILYTIATGRIDYLARRYQREIESELPIVCCNGSLIRDLDNNTLYKKTLNFNIIEELVEFYNYYKLDFMFYNEECVLTSPNNPRIRLLEDFINKCIPQDKFEFKVLKDDIHKYSNMNFLKALVTIDDRGKLLDIQSKLSEKFEDLSVVSSSKVLLDIMPNSINKGTGVYNLCKLLGIKYENVCAFGDNFNDIEMMQSAGVSISPENAEDSIKKLSTYVTKSNDDDGIAFAINEFILKNV